MRIGDLRDLEVINIATGQRLGYVSDAEFDRQTGRILSFLVPGPRKFFGLLPGDTDYVFPWESIVRMGDDAILIHLEGYDPRKTHKNRKNFQNYLC